MFYNIFQDLVNPLIFYNLRRFFKSKLMLHI
jgi:hypothetical protein